MGVVGLAWCVSALSALLALLHSAITYVPPGPGPLVAALPAVLGTGSLVGAAMAIGLGRLPPTGGTRQSSLLWWALAVVVAAEIAIVLAIA